MYIFKRLLNVLVIFSIALFLGGVAYGIDGLYQQLEERRADCERKDGLARVKEKIKNGQRKPVANIDYIAEEMRKSCDRAIGLPDFYEAGRDSFQGALLLIVIVAVLNYILFGKVTLWNRMEHLSREQ